MAASLCSVTCSGLVSALKVDVERRMTPPETELTQMDAGGVSVGSSIGESAPFCSEC